MSNKAEQLKQINAEKKALAKKQKILREELDATKEQRKERRSIKVKCRIDIKAKKTELASCTTSIYPLLSKGTIEDVEELADNIMEVASELAGIIRKFAEASKDPESEEAIDDL